MKEKQKELIQTYGEVLSELLKISDALEKHTCGRRSLIHVVPRSYFQVSDFVVEYPKIIVQVHVSDVYRNTIRNR